MTHKLSLYIYKRKKSLENRKVKGQWKMFWRMNVELGALLWTNTSKHPFCPYKFTTVDSMTLKDISVFQLGVKM